MAEKHWLQQAAKLLQTSCKTAANKLQKCCKQAAKMLQTSCKNAAIKLQKLAAQLAAKMRHKVCGKRLLNKLQGC
jgi:hypothetical protein